MLADKATTVAIQAEPIGEAVETLNDALTIICSSLEAFEKQPLNERGAVIAGRLSRGATITKKVADDLLTLFEKQG